MKHCVSLSEKLTGVPVKKIGGDQGYSGNDNRTFCKENGIETSFTQKGRTGKNDVKNATKKGFEEAREGDSINLAFPDSNTRRGRVGKGCSQTLDCGGQMGAVVKAGRIRRLTPRECFRLQGFPDALFDRAAKVNSDAQLYKQAGNAVTATVAYAVAMSLPESREEI